MKHLLRPILCGGVLAALLCTPSLAAGEGDFSLLVNGEPVTFSDAAPVLKDGRSFLPMAATFEALGFPADQILWSPSARTVTAVKPDVTYINFQGEQAQGDLTVQMSIGSNTISVQYEGNTTAGPHGDTVQVVNDYTADAAPYIDAATSRTYIPVGLVADALGYRVAWDAETYTVIIDDVEAILAENTETYELMDQYMDYADQYSQGTYRVDGSLAFNMSDSFDKVDLTGDYDMFTSQTALQFDADLAINADMSGLEFVLPNLDIALRYDLEAGAFYFQSQALTASDVWYCLDMKALYDEAYGPGFYEELIALDAASASEDMTFAQALEEILKSDALPLTSEFTTRDYLDLFNYVLADSAFERSGSTYTSTPIDLEEDGSRILVAFQLHTSGGKVNGYGLEMTIADTEGTALALTAEMRASKMEMLMDFQMPGELSMTMEIDGAYQRTSTAPATEPPAGATVVDLMDALTGDIDPAPEPEAA